MKDKEKQIQEMANIIKSVKYEPFNDGKPTYTVGNQMQDFVFDLIAEELLKHYQPKLPEDSVVNTPTIQCETYSQNDLVVLSREERQTRDYECQNIGYEIGKKEGSKETAEKFYYLVKEKIEQIEKFYFDNGKIGYNGLTVKELTEIATCEGVEIKE